MNLPESEMSAPVMTWLQQRGFVPYAEVQHRGYWVDIVGLGRTQLIAIEMKMSLTKQVIDQAHRAGKFADYSYCAVLSRPRLSSLIACAGQGIGVLRVKDERVMVLVEAKSSSRIVWGFTPYLGRERIIEALRQRPPGGIAGRPTLKGQGPAQDCARRVKQWRSEHPGCTWAEIYENVDNHYANMKSMRGALTSRGLV